MDCARQFWDALRDRYGRFGGLGHPADPRGLSEFVENAPWPDRDGDSTLIRAFATRLYQNDNASFEAHRHVLANRAYRWWSRANDASDQSFETWLGNNLGGLHLNTVKLCWYVDIAHNDYIGHQDGDFRPHIFLRHVLGE